MSIVAVTGLGDAGLPPVVRFGKASPTIGSDVVELKTPPCRSGARACREIADTAPHLAVHTAYASEVRRRPLASGRP